MSDPCEACGCDDGHECTRCNNTFSVVELGYEDHTGLCDGCAQSEVMRLREGIRRYRVAQGHHLHESWAQHFDELVAPDPLWKAHDDMRREEAARLEAASESDDSGDGK